MYMSLKVLEAIAVLREAAENDFERHRLDVLMRDLTSPPTIEKVDDTHQMFNGITYCTDTTGHYIKGTSIHRAVWSYYNGEILQGYVLHHVDNNPANNSIENLQALTNIEHIKLHNTKIPLLKNCPICGKEFTPKNNHQTYCSHSCSAKSESTENKKKICPVCGKTFIKKRNRQIYCSQNCRIAHQKNHEQKICVICGKKFMTDCKHPKTITCSSSCAGKLASLTRGGHLAKSRKCVICGKEFMPRFASSTERTCSHSCGYKLAKKTRQENSKK